jgi:SAM-dependent methyltransferase
MSETSKRLAQLTPDRRSLIDRLMAAQRHPPAPAPPSAPVPLPADRASPRDPDEVKEGQRRFFDAVTAQLNSGGYGQFSFFLNYGYASDGKPEFATVQLPEHYLNRNSVKLVLEVIGDYSVRGRRVLDVGCGRGGTIHVLTTLFEPQSVTGLDLSGAAIAFCRETHKDPRARFIEGDAENLPFEDGEFDAVTNLESSHCYPHIHRFYAEVSRVLVPGGYFLYTDIQPVPMWTTNLGLLGHLGFTVERDRDITSNVLQSCDQVAGRRVGAYAGGNDSGLLNNFLATPGSQVYDEMRSGRWVYRILTLRRS